MGVAHCCDRYALPLLASIGDLELPASSMPTSPSSEPWQRITAARRHGQKKAVNKEVYIVNTTADINQEISETATFAVLS